MRLGLYLPVLTDRPAGVGVYTDEICSRLCARNPDYVVFTGTPEVSRPWLDRARVRRIGGAPWRPRAVATNARRRAARLLWLATGVDRALRREHVDVLFSPVQEGPLVGRTPSVVVMHDLTALKVPEAFDRLSVLQTRLLVPAMLRRATRVIAVSESTRRDLSETFGVPAARMRVIGEGYDEHVFRPRSAVEISSARASVGLARPYLMYAGTFSRHKNLALVLEALAESIALVGHDLVLVGRTDTGAFGELKARADELGLGARVKTPGYVAREQLAALMSGADAFVFPSRYEGFGLAPLEAMACGAPVVASDAGSLPELIGPGGTMVSEPSPSAWRRAIECTVRGDREQLARAAQARARCFRWEDAAGALMHTLAEARGAGTNATSDEPRNP